MNSPAEMIEHLCSVIKALLKGETFDWVSSNQTQIWRNAMSIEDSYHLTRRSMNARTLITDNKIKPMVTSYMYV